MATSSPPSTAILARSPSSPQTHPVSVSLSSALDFIDSAARQGIVFAPAMPEPEALKNAARAAGITPQQALKAYLSILDYE